MDYQFSAKAEKDFQNIYRYIATDSISSASRVCDQIEKTCIRISDMPEAGTRPAFITDPRVRVIPVSRYKSYLIFYRLLEDQIQIVRILHGARDLPTVFFK